MPSGINIQGFSGTHYLNSFFHAYAIISVQSLSHVWLFATAWIAACQASLSITDSWILPKFMSSESVMPSNHVILHRPLLLLPSIFTSIRIFSNESALLIRWPSIRVSASTSVLPMKTQDWSPLGWTGWISLQSKGLSRVFLVSAVLLILYGQSKPYSVLQCLPSVS